MRLLVLCTLHEVASNLPQGCVPPNYAILLFAYLLWLPYLVALHSNLRLNSGIVTLRDVFARFPARLFFALVAADLGWYPFGACIPSFWAPGIVFNYKFVVSKLLQRSIHFDRVRFRSCRSRLRGLRVISHERLGQSCHEWSKHACNQKNCMFLRVYMCEV